MKLNYNSCMALLCTTLLSTSNLLAQESQLIPFQGTLYQSGTAVNGSVNITFTIADPTWTETHNNVSVTQGVYSVVLGETTSFPEDLFTSATPELVVSIGGTDVATVPLYAPFISKKIVQQNMPDSINGVFNEPASEHNTLIVTVDGTGTGDNAAIEAVAQSSDKNSAIQAFSISEGGNAALQTGSFGGAFGTGTGDHRGVAGSANGQGKYNKGLYGLAQGTGNGEEGYGEGSINFGVEGNAGGNAWSNTGIEGSTFGTEGRVNYGVHGISSAGTFHTSDTLENYGVAGRAYGPGKNYGIYGGAGDGLVNWAGYFDGDVNINGNLTVNGQTNYPGGGENSAGVFDSIQVQNANEDVRAKLSSKDNGGLDLYDRLNEKTFELMSNDTASHFFMYNERIRSSNGNRYPAFWMKNYDWGTYWQQLGIPLEDDPDWEKTGAAYQQVTGNFASYTLETGNNRRKVSLQAGEDYGMIRINSQDNNKVVQAGGKFWEGRSDLGYVAVYGDPDTLDMVILEAIAIDDGANEIGQITLNGTDGSSFTIDSHGIQGGTVASVGDTISIENGAGNERVRISSLASNDAGFLETRGRNDSLKVLIGSANNGYDGYFAMYDSTGVPTHEMRSNAGGGHFFMYNENTLNSNGNGFRYPSFWMKNYNYGTYFQMVGVPEQDDPNWEKLGEAYIQAHGTGSSFTLGSGNRGKVRMQAEEEYGWMQIFSQDWKTNIEMGAKHWEATNGTELPYLKMVGAVEVDDGEGGTFAPDLVWINAVHDEGNGSEFGEIVLRGTDGSEFNISSHGFSGGGQSVLNLNNGGFDYVGIGNKEWEGNGGDERGRVYLQGTDDFGNDNRSRASIEVNNDGSGSYGYIGLQNYVDSGGGNPTETISLNGENGTIYAQSNISTSRVDIQSDWGADGQGAMLLRDANDNPQVQTFVTDDGFQNYSGIVQVSSSQDEFSVEMGGDGYISIHENGVGDIIKLNNNGNIFTPGVQLQSDWGNGSQGSLHLRDSDESERARLSVEENGTGEYYAYFEMTNNFDGGYINMDGNGNINASGIINSGDINTSNIRGSGNVEAGDYYGSGQTSGVIMSSDGTFNAANSIHAGGSIQSGDFDGVTGNGVILFNYGDIDLSQNLNAGGDLNGVNANVIAVHADSVITDYLESTEGTVASSDARFKKNVKSIDGALAKTQQLNGYTYNWNKLAEKQKGIKNKEQQVGVLAQELEAVFPQLVKTDDEGYKAVNYAALTAVLIEAVKELSEQVGTLQGENAELKAELTKVDELEVKIELIQKLLAKQTMEANQATASR